MAGIRAKIYDHAGDLNPSDKKVLNYLLDNAQACSELSLTKLAAKLYVSESAIFRLCKKIGLSGYSELKYELAELSRGESQGAKLQETFINRLTKNIRAEIAYFKTLDLERFYQSLREANNVYIYTTGWQQHSIATYMSHQLLVNTNKPTIVLPSAIDELKMSRQWLKADDLLFVISFSGENKELCDELEELRILNDRFRLTSLTIIKENRLASLSDYSLFFQPSLYTEESHNDSQKWAFSPAYMLVDLMINGYNNWLNKKGE
ncbi:MAG: MurR/RpiR family transcriptional regulator [Lacticaseibacillus absianus]|jgi:RpiR family glv operon transcriptional regulator